MTKVILVPVIKAFTDKPHLIEVDLSKFPAEVIDEILYLDTNYVINRGMLKLTKETPGVREEAIKIAQQNIRDCESGKVKFWHK